MTPACPSRGRHTRADRALCRSLLTPAATRSYPPYSRTSNVVFRVAVVVLGLYALGVGR